MAMLLVRDALAYGIATPFDELRRRLRCGTECGISAGAMLEDRPAPEAARAS